LQHALVHWTGQKQSPLPTSRLLIRRRTAPSLSHARARLRRGAGRRQVEGVTLQGFPTVLVYPRAGKAAPVDVSTHAQDTKALARSVRQACALPARRRGGEAEYAAATRRFRAAARALRGSLLPAAEERDAAAERLERRVAEAGPAEGAAGGKAEL
jgi:hypothetical protein